MSNDEYRQLIEFLGQKFTRVEAQFFGADSKIEQVRDEVREVKAELQEFRGEVRTEIAKVRDLVRVGYTDLERRVRRLEEGR